MVAGAATAVAAALDAPALAGVLGAVTAIIAIWLTFLIASRQAVESGELRTTVEDVKEAVTQIQALQRRAAERDSEQEYEATGEAEPEGESDRPEYSDEVIARLKAKGASISAETASWRRKTPKPALPGNHGWFVEGRDPTKPGRWYVRRAHGLTVRKAMPRDFLETLQNREAVDPRTIKLDFQLKEHGLAAWYARTYDGDLWKVWRPARGWGGGIKVERVDEELAASESDD